jgi:2-succinyl-5-enolpyruvyl-6-hydroxy-3-cyclohexene-1-carboxylate synthase
MNRPRETPLDYRSTNSLWGSVLVETLYQLGLRQAVISPGSRSTPLTMAFARHQGIKSVPVLDERSAGFFALGLAKQLQKPVVLLCTSGTAGANYFPAVIEAQESGIPLLVITADRPPEMRECHSGQTIDQQKLYGSHVNFYHELAVPAADLPMLRYLRQTVVHALERTTQPVRGPVHLNCPFRDPLAPLPDQKQGEVPATDLQGFFAGLEGCPPQSGRWEVPLDGLIWPKLNRIPRGVIVVGPFETPVGKPFARNVGRLSLALGWPVLADALSPVRMHASSAGHLVVHYDAILRSEALAASLQPSHVICLGGWPVSKILREWLQRGDSRTVIVTDRNDNPDALHLRTAFVRCNDLAAWASGFSGRRRAGAYTKQWMDADRQVGSFFAAKLNQVKEMIEPKCIGVLARHLPVRTPCFIANSMPVRDAACFWPANDRAHPVYFNRGANGIDGTLSSALGVAQDNRPAVLLTGDLALLHDTNGFLLRPKFSGSLTIVLINNQGGGIFEHLPVAQFNPLFEEYFATPQEADFKQLCSAYGVTHVRVRNWKHLAGLVAKLPKQGIRVLEVRTDRKRDAAFRKKLLSDAAQAVEQAG